jgi:uncharacterized protein YneF (UPF0154 family)
MNSDEGSDFPLLREGRLATIPGYPKDLMLLLRTLTQAEPSSRPSADRYLLLFFCCPFFLARKTEESQVSRLLRNPALDPSAIKTMSQLKRELREEREKVKFVYASKAEDNF